MGPLTVYHGCCLACRLSSVAVQACLWKLFFWPGLDELVHGADVVDDDLVRGVHVFAFVDVVGDIKVATSVVAELFGQCVPEGLPVPGCQALTFNTPYGNWLDASPVKSKSHT